MSIMNIDGLLLRKMIIAGAKELEKNKQYVDSLNVFPVPDGDTGTNMYLTTLAAAKEVEKLNTANASEIAKAASSGSLRGARGNSGVILSQLFRGFAKGLDGKSKITTMDLAIAFAKASETAYRAVMKPKEGTILTVAKHIAEKTLEYAYDTDDIDELMRYSLKCGFEILAKTQYMLPQLKQAKVVDSGGKGLLCILEGAYNSIYAKEGAVVESASKYATQKASGSVDAEKKITPAAAMSTEEIKFIYCTEFFINLKEKPASEEKIEDDLKVYLEKIGDSIVVVCDERIVKVHVHTNNPGKALEHAVSIGEMSNLKIDNMSLQHTNMIDFKHEAKQAENVEMYIEHEEIGQEIKPVGFVAVAAGSGIAELFRTLGVDEIIEGGQTMNPSTEDILEAASKVTAEKVVILPNNKNVVLAAHLAEELSAEKKLFMLPSKTIPQGISAMVNYLTSNTFEENMSNMNKAMASIKTGSITYAVRATVVNDKEIREGSILCLFESDIVSVKDDSVSAAKELIDFMADETSTVLSIYYGQDISESEAEEIKAYAMETYLNLEVELFFGAQPVYYYIISVE